MSGGPIYPNSVYLDGASGNLWEGFFSGGGGNASPNDFGVNVVASLGADGVAQLRFPMPPTIPSGTLKLRTLLLTSDTTAAHVAKYTISDATVSAGASPSAASLSAETQSTVTLPATPAGKYVETKTALTASPAGNDMLVVAITFNHTGWTISQVACFVVSVIWE